LAELGINVCVLSPGYVRTNLSLNALRPDGSCHAQMDTSTANGMAPETVAKVGACHAGYAVIAIILPCMFSSLSFPSLVFVSMCWSYSRQTLVKCIETGEPDLILADLQSTLAVLLRNACPRLMARLMAARMAKESSSSSK
jgi:short-subunit dehydrogenase